MNIKKFIKTKYVFGLLISTAVSAAVTLPYTFSPSTPIKSSEMNADLGALRDEINNHEAGSNPHLTTLSNILSLGNSTGSNSINFNGNQALYMAVENRTSDPTPSLKGRLWYNTTNNLLMLDNGSSTVTVAGATANSLQSVLNSGNSAGSFNINMNENQLLAARLENLSSDPSYGNSGRIWYNTSDSAIKVDTGSSIATIGGSQGLSSVLGISNSAGSNNLDFNLNQAKNIVLDKLASDPGVGTEGRIYYNTTTKVPRIHNGTSWGLIGNTNTLAQTLALGNIAGTDIDFSSHEAKNMVIYNNLGSPGTGTPGFIWYDTGTKLLNYETDSANHAVVSSDQAQTLTNKSISGLSNTITNIQDSSLSANVDLLGSAQTVSGQKTFSSNPIMGAIQSTSGATMSIPVGISSDTFTFNSATQTLSGKTLASPTITGSANYSNGQAINFRVENLSSDPSPGNAGRIYYKTTTGELKYDTGSNVIVLSQGNPTLSQVLTSGNSAGVNFIDMNGNQIKKMRIENVSSLPSFGSVGRVVFNTADSMLYIDTGLAWSTPAGIPISYIDTDVTLAANSDTKIATQKATKTYVDTGLATKQPTGNYITDLIGDITASGPGSTTATISDITVTGKLLTGFVSGSGSVSSADSILSAFEKIDGNVSGKQDAGNYITALTGDVTADGPGSTVATISDSTVTGKLLTGFVSGAGLVSASDSILSAINKLDGNISTKQASGNYITALTGDVVANGPGSTSATIQSNSVSNSKLAQMSSHTFKGNNTGSTSSPLDLTASQLTAELAVVMGDSGAGGTKGLVPAPAAGDAAAGKFLKADGTWTVTPGASAATLRVPTVQVFTSGSGTYTLPANVTYIKVKMVGGGGGGSTSGTAGSTAAGNGGNTTFGTSLLTAGGGYGATYSGNGGVGGSGTINSPAVKVILAPGGTGTGYSFQATSGQTVPAGGHGGVSYLGGAGGGGAASADGYAAEANSGSGGGGGGVTNASGTVSGSGGGAGGYIEAIIPSPSATYSYSVGTFGAGGAAGTSGHAGGNGGTGYIVVEEY